MYLPEARRGSQGASRAVPGKSGLHAHGEGPIVYSISSKNTCVHCYCLVAHDKLVFEAMHLSILLVQI